MDGTYSHAGRPTSLEDAARATNSSAASADDSALIEACRRGESSAYGELVRRYQDRVFNLCMRMTGSREDAEDHTQEAFVKAFQSLDRFAERAKFYTWVFRIAVNIVISARRKSGRHSTYSLDAARAANDDGESTSLSAGLRSTDTAPDDVAHNRERDRLVLAALDGLDEEQRSIIVLRDMESLSYDEIADILDVPTGTVKSRLHRARLVLRDRLAPILGMD